MKRLLFFTNFIFLGKECFCEENISNQVVAENEFTKQHDYLQKVNEQHKEDTGLNIKITPKVIGAIMGVAFLSGSFGAWRKFTWVSDKAFKAKDWTSDKLSKAWGYTTEGGIWIKELVTGKDYVENNEEVKEFCDEFDRAMKIIRKDKRIVNTLTRPAHIEIGTGTEVHRYYLRNEDGDRAFRRNITLNEIISERFTDEDLERLGGFRVNYINRNANLPESARDYFRDEIGSID